MHVKRYVKTILTAFLLPLACAHTANASNLPSGSSPVGVGPQPDITQYSPRTHAELAQIEPSPRSENKAFNGSPQAGFATFEKDKARALKWELGYLALSGIDAVQTIQCLSKHQCTEANPLFGKHPSASTLILAKLALGSVHFALIKHLNARDPRAALRAAQISCALQGGVVLLNARMFFR